ncbi:MAG: heparan-alpha-glucosaminide N-acetyltransferase domain-containing protein [Saprospiraceae bacterium]|nr:heparan-alpha-glucosaminide N-acetyltransferase domain-containing protein [Saprospiraceae bacterium]
MTEQKSKRIISIDLLRGIVVALMALDHVRFFFHASAAEFSPTNLEKASAMLFFTRWITHFCAPLFLLLAGVSAALMVNKKGIKSTTYFLWTRGLFLIILELLVFRFGWNITAFNHWEAHQMLVISMIGICMIILAGLIYLPPKVILGIGLFIVLLHNLLQNVQISPESSFYNLWVLAYKGGGMAPMGIFRVFVLFAFLPYLGIISCGYGIGQLYTNNYTPEARKKILLIAGSACIVLFIILRTFNIYGDPSHWSPQKNTLYSFLSFINTTKYPTSLLYTLMTIGPGLICLALTENVRGRVNQFFVVLGSVPMFYYILHLFLIQLSSLLLTVIIFNEFGIQKFNLTTVYIVWILVILILYPICAAYRKYKFAHPEKIWLSYI